MSVRLIESAASQADHLRSAVLRMTLSLPGMRSVFISRSVRLGWLFSMSFLVMLLLSLFFPLWVLAIGPAVYGVPHLFSSLRYFHYAVDEGRGSRQQAYRVVGTLTVAVLCFRLLASAGLFGFADHGLSEWKGSTYVELVALGAAFLLGAWLYRKRLAQIASGLLLLAPLIGAFIFEPGWTIGVLVLLHNFVAFAYWRQSAKSPSEKIVAMIAGASVLAVTAVLFLSGFDRILGWIGPAQSLPFASLEFSDLGRLIAPWSDQPLIGLHAAVAYAFGQAMHYFVWLKAIPDQYHHSEVPTSFRQSLSLLERDFGSKWAAIAVILVIGLAGTWIFLEFPKARVLYFAMAAYHGYLEIAGLALSRPRVF